MAKHEPSDNSIGWENGIQAYPVGNGVRWKYRVKVWDQSNNVWRVKEQHGFITRRQAEYGRDKLRTQRFEEQQFPNRHASRLTVEGAMNQWLEDYALRHCKHSTYSSYQQNLNNHIFPIIGQHSLQAITPAIITGLFLDFQLKGFAKQTIKNIFLPLKEAYGHFVARHPERFQQGNPTLCLKPYLKYIRDHRKLVHPLSHESMQTLLDSAQTDGFLSHAMILTALKTGLRRGELIGLYWSDLDLKKRIATIQRAIVRGKETTPKNHQARTLDLSPHLAEVLKSLPQTEARVFPVSASYLNKMFSMVVVSSELPPMRFHDLRHTYASMLIDIGANPKYIQNQLGHSTINVTFDIYGHLFENQGNSIVSKLDTPHQPPKLKVL